MYHNLHTLNVWSVTSHVLAHSSKLRPLVAVQPHAAPPVTVAQQVWSLAELHGRAVDLNLVTGSNPQDFQILGEHLEHGDLYVRLAEHGHALQSLLDDRVSPPVRPALYPYAFEKLKYTLPASLRPNFYVAGISSDAQKLGIQLRAVNFTNPEPLAGWSLFLSTLQERLPTFRHALRVGLVVRPTESEAWQVARARFPTSNKGKVDAFFRSRSTSEWLKRSAILALQNVQDGPFWMGAFLSGQAHCPYLVGTPHQVAELLRQYQKLGCEALLIDTPFEPQDFEHVEAMLDLLFTKTPQVAVANMNHQNLEVP
ncbi:LLM class flavin-dependent oxidoreductase [Deinococcus cellulosilyticus]|uniref:LLM class flavin-dependent oxidoreductase n=1 Tax=Deinococcus cellulosilyticus TaxID=401558 RepID=UPI001649C187